MNDKLKDPIEEKAIKIETEIVYHLSHFGAIQTMRMIIAKALKEHGSQVRKQTIDAVIEEVKLLNCVPEDMLDEISSRLDEKESTNGK